MFLVVDLIETFTKRFQLILMVPDGEFKHILPFFFFSYCMLKDSACFVPMAKVNADLTERLSNAFKSIEQNRAIDFAQNGQSSRASCHRVKIEKKSAAVVLISFFMRPLSYQIVTLSHLPVATATPAVHQSTAETWEPAAINRNRLEERCATPKGTDL